MLIRYRLLNKNTYYTITYLVILAENIFSVLINKHNLIYFPKANKKIFCWKKNRATLSKT